MDQKRLLKTVFSGQKIKIFTSLPLLLSLFLLFSSFFWTHEEQELSEIAARAYRALQNHDYRAAQEGYRTVLKKGVLASNGKSSLLSWAQRIDYSLHLAHVCEQMGEREESLQVLTALIDAQPPPSLVPRILLMRARLLAPQNSPEKSYLMLREIADTLPMEQWSKEDLSFFHALSYALDEYFDSQLKKAKRYYITGFFNEAIALYEEVLTAIDRASFPRTERSRELLKKKIRYALAECHFSLMHDEYSLTLVENPQTDQGKMGREVLYLMALCYKQKQEYEQALVCLEEYAHSSSEELVHYDHALFELGFFYYTHGQTEKARPYFEQLQTLCLKRGRPKFMGGLYLARIALEEGEGKKAETLLEPLAHNLSTEDPILYELFFLQGEAAYLQHHYIEAEQAYVRSLSGAQGRLWGQRAYLHLACCYMQHAQQERLSIQERAFFLTKATPLLHSLLEGEEAPSAVLALANLVRVREKWLGEKEAAKQIAVLFTQYTSIFSLAQQHEALLLHAQVASPETQHALLQEATENRFASLPTYIEAWYARGVAAFREGREQHTESKMDEAIAAFEQAWGLCHIPEPPLAAQIVKLYPNHLKNHLSIKAKSYSYCNSLELLDPLLTECIETGQEREETLYLYGLVASCLNAFCRAEKALLQVISLEGRYAPKALYVLGTLYFQNHEYAQAHTRFLQLAQRAPQAPQSAEAWFWAAESLEACHTENEKVQAYREILYIHYPEHPRAAEAYFRLYPYQAYVKGIPEALIHLAPFPTLFPHSPLCLPAYYLQSLHCKEAIPLLTRAIHLLPQITTEGELPDSTTLHFYYQAMLHLANLYLRIPEEKEEGIALLQHILTDFTETNSPLKAPRTVPDLYARATYTLAKTYLEQGHRAKGEQLFLELLTAFREAAVEEGLYLALCWEEQGRLAMADGECPIALNCFEIAEAAGKIHFDDEQKFTLWLEQSSCYRRLKDYDAAMHLLSKVINTDAVSPLRIRALFLRAEIYRLQGHPELATRQLEAIVKKGGEWAVEAQKILNRANKTESTIIQKIDKP